MNTYNTYFFLIIFFALSGILTNFDLKTHWIYAKHMFLYLTENKL